MFYHWFTWQIELMPSGSKVSDETFGWALRTAMLLGGLGSKLTYEELYPQYSL